MDLNNIIEKFSDAKVLIIGDLVLDRFIRGEANRVSPEAPVPVVKVNNETYCLGTAGNVANNIVSLGGNVTVCGIVGRDNTAEILREQLLKKNIGAGGVFTDSSIPTSVKTRIIAGHQQVVRFDRETVRDIPLSISQKILKFISKEIPNSDAVLISDYGKGVVTESIIKETIRLTKKYKKIVTVDPKMEHFRRYRGVDCITPNLSEAMAGMYVARLKTQSDFNKLGKQILRELKCRSVLITQGKSGMTLFERTKRNHIPTAAKEVFDVTGAGDTVIAALTLALASGASLLNAAKIANYAAGIVVGKLGTAVVSPKELTKILK
ncbi:MAG: D-glycero-beta-D-manno-heptose-7-phosphate kinase [Elusimicrobia bacterium]|nr:D-glycero-beta-D-manno-heptose-7-phosphate kinase [Elusimicrobiota bacterium]